MKKQNNYSLYTPRVYDSIVLTNEVTRRLVISNLMLLIAMGRKLMEIDGEDHVKYSDNFYNSIFMHIIFSAYINSLLIGFINMMY